MGGVGDDPTQLRGVYIVGEVGRVDPRAKIGMTFTSRASRLNSLKQQTSGPLEPLFWWDLSHLSEPDVMYCERRMHEHFADLRVYGEWFHLRDELAQFVAAPSTIGGLWCVSCGGIYGAVWPHPDEKRCIGCNAHCDTCRAHATQHVIYTSQRTAPEIRNPSRCLRCWEKLAAEDGRDAHPILVHEGRRMVKAIRSSIDQLVM